MTRSSILPIVAVLLLFTARSGSARTPKESIPEKHIPEECADTLAEAASPRLGFEMGIELLSSYVSRGSYQAGASFQPFLRVSWGGQFIGAWASTDFSGTQMREVNLSLGYRKGRFEAALIDYYIAPHPEAEGRFFDFGHRSAHTFEASLSWSVSERVPIGIWWGTMFAGADVADDGRRNYSSYAEISYPFALRQAVDFKTGVGFMPWSTENCFNTRGFAVTNVYLHAAKTWTLRRNLRLGLLARIICNPYREQFNFVGGVRFEL